jgi:hypothetical protein
MRVRAALSCRLSSSLSASSVAASGAPGAASCAACSSALASSRFVLRAAVSSHHSHHRRRGQLSWQLAADCFQPVNLDLQFSDALLALFQLVLQRGNLGTVTGGGRLFVAW